MLYFLYRDLVHRQTASAVVQHMSLGVYGFGCEDSLNHLLNYVWPNVFETSPHVIQAVMGALEGLRVAIGPCRMLQYCLQVNIRWDCLHGHVGYRMRETETSFTYFQPIYSLSLFVVLQLWETFYSLFPFWTKNHWTKTIGYICITCE